MIPVSRMFGRLGRVLAWIQLLWILPAGAQWITQTNQLKGGWNAVYLHVDASHAAISDVMASATSIEEVWMWMPASTQQFIDSPQTPSATSSQWSRWTRSLGASSPLQRLIPNAAYYVKVTDSLPTYSWALKGRPVAPQYVWTSSGLNFIGFPTPSSPVGYERFLQPVPSLLDVSEIYRSSGGSFGAANPVRVFDLARTTMNRGDAVWMRVSSGYNRYFGPFEVSLPGSQSLSFGRTGTQISFRIRNQTATTNVITLNLIPSETPPTGQSNIVGIPPLILRGSVIPSTLQYNYQELATNQPATLTLLPKGQAGSDVQVVLGLARNRLAGSPGDLSAAVLQLSDTNGLLRVDLGVSATKSSTAGLWVGEAQVTKVVQYLKTFDRDPVGKPVVKLTGNEGAYSVLYTNEVVGGVAKTFPLRLIVHDDGTNAVLMQRVFLGLDAWTNSIVAAQQKSLMTERLSSARRISAAHLPWSATNAFWPMTLVSNVYRAQIVTPYDQSSVNPFIHQYHPDHDNLTATFSQVQPKGQESYGITRTIWLSPQAAGTDYQTLTSGSMDRNGIYDETIAIEGSGATARTFRVIGTFSLNRISDISTLTR